MKTALLEFLVCPICKGKLKYNAITKELTCRFDRLIYPVRHNVPIMLLEYARKLSDKGAK